MDVIAELARTLRVEVGDLLGQPVLVEDERQDDDIPAIRDALRASDHARHAALAIERHWFDYQHGKLGLVVAALPKLIEVAQQLEDETTPAERAGLCRLGHTA